MAAVAALALLVGLWLMLTGRGMRRRRGLGDGRKVSLDKITLISARLGLTGRPDRLVKAEGTIIPEEWKSARTVRPWHRAQMGVYFLLIEEELRIRPPHGFIVCGDGTRHRVENDDALRAWVLDLAGQIRTGRGEVSVPIPVRPVSGQCRPCGMRGNCGQARLSGREGKPLAGVDQFAELVADTDPLHGSASALQALPDDLPRRERCQEPMIDKFCLI